MQHCLHTNTQILATNDALKECDIERYIDGNNYYGIAVARSQQISSLQNQTKRWIRNRKDKLSDPTNAPSSWI